MPFFDASAADGIRDLSYPRAYLNFETLGFAVPEVIGSHPYERLPFQWSVHIEHSAGDIAHHECLAIETFADFDTMSIALIAAHPDAGPIFAYNASFEMRVLLRLAELAQAEAPALRAFAARLVDLLPITRAAYFHRDMRGSWSIKSVVPTIDPSLGYTELSQVPDGGTAQEAFLRLRSRSLSPDEAYNLKKSWLIANTTLGS